MSQAFRQSDPKWANRVVGFGNSTQTFRYVGCTVCDITYLLNEKFGYNLTPDQVNEKLKVAKAFVGAAVLWANVSKAFPELKWAYRDHNYNNLLVWSWINVFPHLPVLVEVYKPESTTSRHWVLYLGGQKMYDPIQGAIIPTGTKGYTPATGSSRFTRA